MLSDSKAIATVAVKDLKIAAMFYEDKLGLKVVSREGDQMVAYQCGSSVLDVYQSEFAGTNKATAVSWAVGDDLAGVVQALKAKGVVFEHYEIPGTTLEGDVHIGGKMRVAWFKDPDGNILNIGSR
jgi:catechol 2,3-dioxygenase-like lactoylglutathione lyase family enzyme